MFGTWLTLHAMLVAILCKRVYRELHGGGAVVRGGHQVRALVWPTSRRDHIQEFVSEWRLGDQSDPQVLAGLVAGAEAVVHASADWNVLREVLRTISIATSLLRCGCWKPRAFRRSSSSCLLALRRYTTRFCRTGSWTRTIPPGHRRFMRLQGRRRASLEGVSSHLWDEHQRAGGLRRSMASHRN